MRWSIAVGLVGILGLGPAAQPAAAITMCRPGAVGNVRGEADGVGTLTDDADADGTFEPVADAELCVWDG